MPRHQPHPAAALPTLCTLANLACGLLAIAYLVTASVDGPHPTRVAAWLILLAMIFDAVDGLAARATRTASDFGRQLDSLADMVSFGAAPAVLVVYLGRSLEDVQSVVAVGAAVFYAGCVGLRLARYNARPAGPGFAGLPCPAAAAVVASLCVFQWRLVADAFAGAGVWFVLLAVVSLAALMLSGLRYPHAVKLLQANWRSPALIGALIVTAALAVAARTVALPALAIGYVIVPPALTAARVHLASRSHA